MHALILAVSLLSSGPGENGWPTRDAAWQWVTKALAALAEGAPNVEAEVALFGADESQTSVTEVALPPFVFTTVTTTVPVPDGGQVLLDGIRRKAQSPEQLVTPQIIIQEEDEEKLGLTIPEIQNKK